MESLDLCLSISSRQLEQERKGWTCEEKQLFEDTPTEFNTNSINLYEKIAPKVPGENINEQIRKHYETCYKFQSNMPDQDMNLPMNEENPATRGKSTRRRQTKRWTEQEHELFLTGLGKYGRGEWKSISKDYVLSKTPSQISSHAQNYFKRNDKPGSCSTRRRRPHAIDFMQLDNCTTSSKRNKVNKSLRSTSAPPVTPPQPQPTPILLPVAPLTYSPPPGNTPAARSPLYDNYSTWMLKLIAGPK